MRFPSEESRGAMPSWRSAGMRRNVRVAISSSQGRTSPSLLEKKRSRRPSGKEVARIVDRRALDHGTLATSSGPSARRRSSRPAGPRERDGAPVREKTGHVARPSPPVKARAVRWRARSRIEPEGSRWPRSSSARSRPPGSRPRRSWGCAGQPSPEASSPRPGRRRCDPARRGGGPGGGRRSTLLPGLEPESPRSARDADSVDPRADVEPHGVAAVGLHRPDLRLREARLGCDEVDAVTVGRPGGRAVAPDRAPRVRHGERSGASGRVHDPDRRRSEPGRGGCRDVGEGVDWNATRRPSGRGGTGAEAREETRGASGGRHDPDPPAVLRMESQGSRPSGDQAGWTLFRPSRVRGRPGPPESERT